MRVLRAATTAFLAIAVWHIAVRVPLQPAYFVTAAFSAMCFGKLKLPAYAVYATVGTVCGLWLALT
jgi:chromate transporter